MRTDPHPVLVFLAWAFFFPASLILILAAVAHSALNHVSPEERRIIEECLVADQKRDRECARLLFKE